MQGKGKRGYKISYDTVPLKGKPGITILMGEKIGYRGSRVASYPKTKKGFPSHDTFPLKKYLF